MKNNNILVKIYTKNKVNVLKRLIKANLLYTNFEDKGNYVLLIINLKDFKTLKKLFKTSDIKIVKYYGLNFIKNFIRKYYITLCSVVFGLLVTIVMSNIIFKIEIDTENTELKEVITDELEENGIKENKFKKSYNELQKIKKIILNKNKDKLEWIEIEEHGTKYIVKLTARKLNKKTEKKDVRNIVSKKDAVIKKITSNSGVLMKEKNDFVKKGEVIITGNIIKGEDKLKGQVAADGMVFGEVWYLVNVEVPYNMRVYYKTGKEFSHYYLDFFGKKMSLINHYKVKNYKKTKEKVVDKFYLPFDIYKEHITEYKYKNIKLDKKEALNKAIKESEKKIKVKLGKEEHIISKKVLKKEYFSSKINIEVFYKVYENITSYSDIPEFKKDSEENDS